MHMYIYIYIYAYMYICVYIYICLCMYMQPPYFPYASSAKVVPTCLKRAKAEAH